MVWFWLHWLVFARVDARVDARAEQPWLDPNRALQRAQPAPVPSCDPPGSPALPSAGTWERAGFKRPRVETLDLSAAYPPGTTYSHQFDLSLVSFRGSRWKAAEVRARLPKLARIYARCGIRIGRATLVESEAWEGRLDMHGGDDPDVGIEKSIAAALPGGVDRPVLFFVRSFDDGTMAAASPAYYAPPGHPLLNTVFLSDSGMGDSAESPYSTEAHELAHVLGNFRQHTRDGVPNLMSDARSAAPNGTLTATQCDQIKKNTALVKPVRIP